MNRPPIVRFWSNFFWGAVHLDGGLFFCVYRHKLPDFGTFLIKDFSKFNFEKKRLIFYICRYQSFFLNHTRSLCISIDNGIDGIVTAKINNGIFLIFSPTPQCPKHPMAALQNSSTNSPCTR